jgi:hypothetical protein
MTEYQVPASGLAAAMENAPEELDPLAVALILEAFIRWQSENPVMPTKEWMDEQIQVAHPSLTASTFSLRAIAEWQRRMYLAPAESDPPEEIKDLLVAPPVGHGNMWNGDEFNEAVLTAFRRGQQSQLTPPPLSCLEAHEIEAHNARCQEFLNQERAKLGKL